MALSGCQGGGGSAGAAAPVAPSATLWNAPNTTKTYTGVSVGGSVNNPAPLTDLSGGSALILTYDSNAKVSAVTLNTPGVNQTWTSSNSTFLQGTIGGSPSIPVVQARDNAQQNVLTMADPVASSFQYQTYGVWGLTNVGGGAIGAISAGSPTAGTSVPSTGTATFQGTSFGAVGSTTGPSGATVSNATLTADFASRSVAFATSNTQMASTPGNFQPASSYNLSGTMSYSAGSATMSGPVKNGAGFSGSVNGQFYGPAANEVGGTYLLSGTGSVQAGGYGAK